MITLKALLFDVDGTLADTERDGHRVAFNRAFEDARLDWRWDADRYGELLEVSGGKERIQAFASRHSPGFETPGGIESFAADIHRLKTRHYLGLLSAGGIPLRPGVSRLLAEARAAGLRLGIATTTTRDNVEVLLRTTLGEGSVSWFDVIAAGDIVAAKKPAPDIYLHALERLGLNGADCLAIEDSRNGLLAATRAGIGTIVTVNDYTRRQDLGEAAVVLDQLGEPDSGFRVLSGDAGGATMVDVAFLRSVHARSVA